MENLRKKFKAVIILLAISSLSVVLTLCASYTLNWFTIAIAYALPFIFWGCMCWGYKILLFDINKIRRKAQGEIKKKNYIHLPGIICFFSNKYAKIADITMIVSFVVSLILYNINILNGILFVITVPIFLFSIQMHCILNGVNYEYITNGSEGE